MKVKYAVTFEFDSRAPITHRGEVASGTVGGMVSRACREAKRVIKPREWGSMVCFLERAKTEAGEVSE